MAFRGVVGGMPFGAPASRAMLNVPPLTASKRDKASAAGALRPRLGAQRAMSAAEEAAVAAELLRRASGMYASRRTGDGAGDDEDWCGGAPPRGWLIFFLRLAAARLSIMARPVRGAGMTQSTRRGTWGVSQQPRKCRRLRRHLRPRRRPSCAP